MKKPLLMFMLGLLIASAAMAAVPNQMNVQGRLLNGGDPMTGSHPADFNIYDAATAGNLLWTESSSLIVQGGIFTATLGSATPIPTIVFAAETRWLEVTVDGTVLNPRLQLTTSAYAFRSQRADTANVALSGVNELWSTDNTSIWRASGNVGIGTTSPEQLLHLEKGSGVGASMLLRSYVAGTGSLGKLQFQNVLVQDQGIAAEIEAIRPSATWGQESALLFKTNPGNAIPAMIERVRISHDGNVGIGTPSPRDKLEVYDGRMLVTGSGPHDTAKLYFINTAAGGNRGWAWQALDGGEFELEEYGVANGRIMVSPGGNVGIGATSPGQKLYVNGDFTTTGAKCRAVLGTNYGDLYFNAVESDHANFTSSGRNALKDGKCHIELNPRWLAGVTIDDQHPLDVVSVVFYGRHGDWYAIPGTTGFDVVDPDCGSSEFFWTAQARQKGYEDLNLNRPEQTAAK